MKTIDKIRIRWNRFCLKMKRMFRRTPKTEPEVKGSYAVFVRDLDSGEFNTLKGEYPTYKEARKAQKYIQRRLTCVSTWIEYRRERFNTRRFCLLLLNSSSRDEKVDKLERLLDGILLRGCVMLRDIDKLDKLGIPVRKVLTTYFLHTDSPFFEECVRTGSLSSEFLMLMLGMLVKTGNKE